MRLTLLNNPWRFILRTLYGAWYAVANEERMRALEDEIRELKLKVDLAGIDDLTGLANFSTGIRRIAAYLSDAQHGRKPIAGCVGVIFIDCDRLKYINDTRGHAAGDALLCKTARALEAACREFDLPFRKSGDEFIVILHDADLNGTAVFAERLKKKLEEADVQASIGGTSWAVGQPMDSLELINTADQAMYAAKRQHQPNPCIRPFVPA